MRAGRLLSILMLLQVHRRLTARDLAGRRVGGGWSLIDDYQTRLTGLTPPEIQSLFLSRRTPAGKPKRRGTAS